MMTDQPPNESSSIDQGEWNSAYRQGRRDAFRDVLAILCQDGAENRTVAQMVEILEEIIKLYTE